MTDTESLEAKVERIKAILVGVATSNSYHFSDEVEYQRLRKELIANPQTKVLLPKFVAACRTFGEFWGFIKHKFGTYKERRDYLADEFRLLLDALESGALASPADRDVADSLKSFSARSVDGSAQPAGESPSRSSSFPRYPYRTSDNLQRCNSRR